MRVKELSQKLIELTEIMNTMIGDCYDNTGNEKENVNIDKLNLTNKVKHDIVNNMMVFTSLMATINQPEGK